MGSTDNLCRLIAGVDWWGCKDAMVAIFGEWEAKGRCYVGNYHTPRSFNWQRRVESQPSNQANSGHTLAHLVYTPFLLLSLCCVVLQISHGSLTR